MANYLDAHPDQVETLTWWRTHGNGRMVPIAQDGEFVLMIARQHMSCMKPDPSITVADYVVGLELLGYKFFVWYSQPGNLGVGRTELDFGDEPYPDSWNEHALALMGAFDRQTRRQELLDFLIERDGVWTPVSQMARDTVAAMPVEVAP